MYFKITQDKFCDTFFRVLWFLVNVSCTKEIFVKYNDQARPEDWY